MSAGESRAGTLRRSVGDGRYIHAIYPSARDERKGGRKKVLAAVSAYAARPELLELMRDEDAPDALVRAFFFRHLGACRRRTPRDAGRSRGV